MLTIRTYLFLVLHLYLFPLLLLCPEKAGVKEIHGYGSWEPTLDSEWWKESGLLHLFIQKVDQVDDEGISSLSGQPVKILEWTPEKPLKHTHEM